jgi:hypothetical protein
LKACGIKKVLFTKLNRKDKQPISALLFHSNYGAFTASLLLVALIFAEETIKKRKRICKRQVICKGQVQV